MIVLPFFVEGLAHSSYLVGGDSCCAIVDPSRDVAHYIGAADGLGLRITHVLETHLHADFVSGHLELAEKTGAEILAPASANCAFEHRPVSEGDKIALDHIELRVFETPGHTPEHISYVAIDRRRGADPVGVFCGDTLFVGDVGRPDLFPGRAEELAEKLFVSVHEKLATLPDFCEVYPAHGAGSLCGRAMSAKRSSTIGFEKRANPALKIEKKQDFVASLTRNMPPAPDHFSICTHINRQGPAKVAELPRWKRLKAPAFFAQSQRPDTFVLDVRSYSAFGGQHVPGAINIDFRGNFPTFAGWVVPYDKALLLVVGDKARGDNNGGLEKVVTWLRRVGLDRVEAVLDGGMFGWGVNGLPSDHILQLSAVELYERITAAQPLQLLDVRAPQEFDQAHIDGALNIPAPDVRHRHDELRKDVATAITCSTGYRSSLAASILAGMGFKKLFNVAGGMNGYHAAGHLGRCRMCVAPHGPQVL